MADNSGRPDPWPTIAKLFAALLAAGVLVAGLALPYVGGLGLVAGHQSDKFRDTACNLQESKPPQRTTLYARDGKTVIATLFSQDRVPVRISQIPKYLQQALVATEDRRFYSHHGVDMRGLIRSAVSTSGGDTQGGSTLTMQYAKQIRYYQAGDNTTKQQAAVAQNLERKIEDAKCALYFENTLHESKDTILTNYLNIAFFGEHSYGIQTAAETYFNKPASKLALGESATLVGLLRAPSEYDPFVNRAEAKQRRDHVLQNLAADKKISQQTADREKALPIALATQAPPQVKQGCANANSSVPNSAFFCDYAVRWLKNVNGLSDTRLNSGGLKIVTTLDAGMQKSAQERIEKAVPPSSPMTAVLPAVDPKTGDVEAMATSKHYGASGRSETEQPVFTSYTAQGASTFKLFPLLEALSIGVPSDWQLETAGSGASYTTRSCLTKSKSSNGDANVSYNLNETLDSATAKSSNTFFVGMADMLLNCKLQPMIDMAKRLGMNSLAEPSELKHQTLGQAIVGQQAAQRFVLGSVPTSPLELAGAYAAVANGGRYNAPAPIRSITDNTGSAIAVKRAQAVQVVSPYTAAQAVKILQDDTQGDGTSAAVFQNWYGGGGSMIAGKTGTNESTKQNKNSSVWFVGMTPNLVAASGLINFETSSAPSSGLPGKGTGEAYGDYASKVWLRSLQPSLDNRKWTWDAPSAVPGQDVPSVEGLSLDEAKKTLVGQFKLQVLGGTGAIPQRCPGPGALDTIAYYGPHRAPVGSTITVCISTGVRQQVYSPPVIITPRRGNGNNNRNGRGNNRRGNGNNRRGSGSGNGGGGGGGHTTHR